MALLVTSAGTSLAISIESIKYDEKIDDPVTCTFDVPDSVAYSLSQYQVVQVTDTVTSTLLYAGYIVSVADAAFPGNLGIRMRTITCTGNRWLAEKRYWTGPEFDGWTAGDVAAEVHRVVLASEGVTAAYALRHDMDAATFGAGTLVGTTAAGGTLTLASAGSDFTQTETSTADFNTGTLTTIGGSNGALALTSYLAIKYSGSAGANLDNNNLYSYRKIWAGSAYTLVALDEIYVDQWIDSRSPEIKAGIDLLFSDGSWMHDYSTDFQDQEVIPLDPATDLKGWADDQWYSRKCIVPATRAGLVVVAAYLVFQGEKGGDYSAYFKNIKITNSGGATLRRSIFSGGDTTLAANVKASSNGYYNTAAALVTAYAETGVRVSPARSLASVGIVSGSIINWTEVDTVQPAGATNTYPPQVLIEASMDDGATWDTCTNHAPLPSLLVGMNTAGRTVTLRETLSIGGPDPTRAPTLSIMSFTVYSAAAASKTDFFDFRQTQAQLAAGVLTNATSYSGVGLQTTGNYRNWDNLDFSSQTLFGQSGAGNPQQGVQTGYFYLRTDSGLDVRSQFNFAGGNWQNFIAEIDIHFVSNVGGTEYGFVYRTTGWSNTNNTYAYAAEITSSRIILNKAANGGTPSFTTLQSVSLSLTAGAWYRMKVVVNGSSHKVFINDVLFINWTDSTYTAAGYVGVRLWNSTGNRDSAHFDNFGIVAYESDFQSVSTWVTPALALSLTGLVGRSQLNWNAQVPSSSTLLVESTLDNGTTWNTCTNGSPIPLLAPGYNMAGQSLKVRYTMINQSINLPIVIQGHSVFVIGQYSASGTRVSPVLTLGNAGRIGGSSISWNALTPVGTTLGMDTSPNGTTWTDVSGSNGGTIPGYTVQGTLFADDFTDSVAFAANYTSTFDDSGAVSTWTLDTVNSRLTMTGTNEGVLVYTGVSRADMYAETIMDQAANAGLECRRVNASNAYKLYIYDASSGAPNTFWLYKIVAGVYTQLATGTIAFTRGTYHTFRLSTIGSTISATMDGQTLASVTDSGVTAAGQAGLHGSAGLGRFYSLNVQPLGQDLSVGGALAPKLSGISLFPPDNVWNQDISQLPVHSSSAFWLNAMGPTMGFQAKVSPLSIGWSIPYNLVNNSTPTYAVTYFYPGGPSPFPIPASPLIEEPLVSGSDRHMLCLNTDTGMLYEMTSVGVDGSGHVISPVTAASGALWNMASNTLGPDFTPSADAAGLPILPGLLRYDEIVSGTINHALRCAMPLENGHHIWPARSEAFITGGTNYPPNGTRFRLKASVAISGFSKTNQIILTALKRYGCIAADGGTPNLLRLYGPPDDRWDFNDIQNVLNASIHLSDFEIIDESGLMLSSSSGGTGKATQVVYTRQRLGSTDPTQKPSVSSLVVGARSPDIMTGALINATDYAYKKKCSEILLDVAGQSKFYLRIDKNKKLLMKDRAYSTAPWPLYSADPLFLGTRNPPTATRQSPAYRNRQYVYNCVDLQNIPESKTGDGTAQSWPLAYQVDSITSLTLDGNPQTVGVQGVDTGRAFYYQPGQAGFSQDASGTPPDRTQTISLVYVARVPYTSMRESTAQQAILQGVDGTSGIVEASEDGGGISKAAGDVIAQARIDANAILSLDWKYFTSRGGLQPGQLQTMFVPEYGLNDVDMLITEISTALWLDGNGNLQYEYDVKATSGPNVGTWSRLFAQP